MLQRVGMGDGPPALKLCRKQALPWEGPIDL